MIERLVHEQAHQIHDVGGGGLIAAGICSGVIAEKPKVKGPVDSRELQAPYFNLTLQPLLASNTSRPYLPDRVRA